MILPLWRLEVRLSLAASKMMNSRECCNNMVSKLCFPPYRTGYFYLLETVAGLASLPKAYFDWSFGLMKTDPKDLSLDIRLCDQKAANRVATWYADLYNRGGRT